MAIRESQDCSSGEGDEREASSLHFLFWNPNLYSGARTKKHRGGHVKYVLCLGVCDKDDEPELAGGYGQR